MARALPLAALLLILLPTLCRAADLRITDGSGAQVVVRNASIDYSGAIGTAVREADGIRVQQGEADVRIKWKDIESLTIVRAEGSSKRLDAVVLLRSGRRVTVTLQRPGDAKLRGKSDVGDYAVDLDKVQSIEPLR